MPELPEVETTRRAIEPYICGQRVREVVVRDARLRWPVDRNLNAVVAGRIIGAIARRGKYLLFDCGTGSLIIHLGMSGSLRLTTARAGAGPYDHVDIVMADGGCLRLRDPRRFGAVLWSEAPNEHALIRHLGPEPLATDCSVDYLFAKSRGRQRAIKDFLMDSRIVVGIGNIYANEALFRAGIHPKRAAGGLTRERYRKLLVAIRTTLKRAIRAGGTTLRDFHSGDGKPGHFQQALQVYGRAGAACPVCAEPIRSSRMGARSTFFCRRCQR